MNKMFSNTAITNLDLSHFNTIQLLDATEMFYRSSNMTSLDLRN